ncbi:MAG: aminotransferase class I/II-fold pyridoxal phosphate-dependent enzyme [Gaiellaceae bacterium]|jgi:histidinol-phosphate aminotransferase
MRRGSRVSRGLIRPALESIEPYEGGKPIEEVERELGIARAVKLASNEGPFGPFPIARQVLETRSYDLNRYPDGGAYRVRAALAERLGVDIDEIAHGAGADGLIGYLSLALLDPGDEVVFGWPSFTSYMLSTLKVGAVPRTVPLRDHRYDLEAMLARIGAKTRIVYICNPNNPTGTMNSRDELDAYFERVPDHVLTVIDQAYLEYVENSDYPDAVADYFKQGKRVLVLRSFSKIYGLAGLRIGYAVASKEICAAIAKVRPAFDVNSAAQEAALASLIGDDAEAELARRRSYNGVAVAELGRILRAFALEPVGPAVANFLFVELGEDSRRFFEQLLQEGVIVRPLHGFGAPNAIRVTAGSADDHAVLRRALRVVRPGGHRLD